MTALRRSGIEPRQLVLEITETAIIDNASVLTNVQNLRNLGVAISLDAGTGYNFIGRLESLPVDTMKIDKRFLDESTPSADKLLRLLVQSAHAFNLPVVAEGVEHQAQLDVLNSIHCDFAQGYLLGRPLDPAEIDAAALVPRSI